VTAGTHDGAVWVEGPATLTAADVAVPGDFSSAVFLVALALLLEDSDVTIRGVGLNPTRTRLLDVLGDLGASLDVSGSRLIAGEPVGDLRVRYSGRLGLPGGGPLELGAADVAALVDEIPVLAVIGATIAGGVRISGAAELRRKESDRLAALAEGLERMGASVRVAEDGIAIEGAASLHGARVRAWGDHRIAMAFSCAAMAAEGATVVEDPAVVGVSFPGFFEQFPPGAVTWSADVLG
jgi:3-phosphoshikimate 1-carboxyvinyltransferase